MASINTGVLAKNKEKKKSSVKPVLYCIAAFFVVTLICNFLLESDISTLSTFSNIYLSPFHLLVFDKIGWNITSGLLLGIFILFFAGITLKPNNKLFYYISGFIIAYLVYLMIWIFGRVFIQSISQISNGLVLESLVPLILSSIIVLFLVVIHIVMYSDIYAEYLIEESEAFQSRIQKEKIEMAEKKRLRDLAEQNRIIEEANRNTNVKTKTNDNKKYKGSAVVKTFEENEEIASKIRAKVSKVPNNTKLSFDTNIMIKCPLLVKELASKYSIVLSKKTFEELDKKKSDNEIGANARMAMRTIEAIQTKHRNISIVTTDDDFVKDNGLNPLSPDDIIIACCLKQQINGDKITFVTEDRGARITARNLNIDVLDFTR